ncbi:hypothetical protein GCM10010524_46090 [Streptomyces mexicanus]
MAEPFPGAAGVAEGVDALASVLVAKTRLLMYSVLAITHSFFVGTCSNKSSTEPLNARVPARTRRAVA